MNSFLLNLPADILRNHPARLATSPSGEPRERNAALVVAMLAIVAAIVSTAL